MAETKFRHCPTPKRFIALQYLYDKKTEYLLFGGGAGGGKGWLGYEWLLAMALNFPNTQYFTGTERHDFISNSDVTEMAIV